MKAKRKTRSKEPAVGISDLGILTLDHPSLEKCSCWSAAISLFDSIVKHHGEVEAKKIFAALADPTKKQRMRLADVMLWSDYELLRIHYDNLDVTKTDEDIYKELYQRYPKNSVTGEGYASAGAIKKKLLELRKKPPM